MEAEQELGIIEAELMNNIRDKAVKKATKRKKSSQKNAPQDFPEVGITSPKHN